MSDEPQLSAGDSVLLKDIGTGPLADGVVTWGDAIVGIDFGGGRSRSVLSSGDIRALRRIGRCKNRARPGRHRIKARPVWFNQEA